MQDLGTVALLIFLEGILSIDNAVVLALIAGRLPKHLQKRALTYGIVGAIFFRLVCLGMASYLMRWTWVKFVGGGYLLYLGVSHWLKPKIDEGKKATQKPQSFWKTVILIELMDLGFAIDSILAAVAISDKLWVVFLGGVLGMLLMRFAVTTFIKLLEVFPSFEDSAYLLIVLIGGKLAIEGFQFEQINFHSYRNPAFWIFWIGMGGSLLLGFRKKQV